MKKIFPPSYRVSAILFTIMGLLGMLIFIFSLLHITDPQERLKIIANAGLVMTTLCAAFFIFLADKC